MKLCLSLRTLRWICALCCAPSLSSVVALCWAGPGSWKSGFTCFIQSETGFRIVAQTRCSPAAFLPADQVKWHVSIFLSSPWMQKGCPECLGCTLCHSPLCTCALGGLSRYIQLSRTVSLFRTVSSLRVVVGSNCSYWCIFYWSIVDMQVVYFIMVNRMVCEFYLNETIV